MNDVTRRFSDIEHGDPEAAQEAGDAARWRKELDATRPLAQMAPIGFRSVSGSR
jgi:hypothetical protein